MHIVSAFNLGKIDSAKILILITVIVIILILVNIDENRVLGVAGDSRSFRRFSSHISTKFQGFPKVSTDRDVKSLST